MNHCITSSEETGVYERHDLSEERGHCNILPQKASST